MTLPVCSCLCSVFTTSRRFGLFLCSVLNFNASVLSLSLFFFFSCYASNIIQSSFILSPILLLFFSLLFHCLLLHSRVFLLFSIFFFISGRFFRFYSKRFLCFVCFFSHCTLFFPHFSFSIFIFLVLPFFKHFLLIILSQILLQICLVFLP